MSHLYLGGGFPRASQCITTFFSSPSKGKTTSSGSWMKTGPNSSLSVRGKKRREGWAAIITASSYLPCYLVSGSADILATSIAGNKRKRRCEGAQCEAIINSRKKHNNKNMDVTITRKAFCSRKHIFLTSDDTIGMYCVTDLLVLHSRGILVILRPGGWDTSEGKTRLS